MASQSIFAVASGSQTNINTHWFVDDSIAIERYTSLSTDPEYKNSNISLFELKVPEDAEPSLIDDVVALYADEIAAASSWA